MSIPILVIALLFLATRDKQAVIYLITKMCASDG